MSLATPCSATSTPRTDPHTGELLAIAVGGAVGALARVGLSQAFPTTPGHWPWVTFSINLAGAFLLGLFVTLLDERGGASARVGADESEDLDAPSSRTGLARPLLTTGLCGTFTTFSTVQLELLRMIDQHRYGLAATYIAASVLGGLLAVIAATAAIRRARSSG